jgi:hypothetical protein
LCFVNEISPYIKSDGTIGYYNYVGVQEQKNEFRVSKFDILKVRPIQIPTKNGGNLSFEKRIGTRNKTAQSKFENLTFLGCFS